MIRKLWTHDILSTLVFLATIVTRSQADVVAASLILRTNRACNVGLEGNQQTLPGPAPGLHLEKLAEATVVVARRCHARPLLDRQHVALLKAANHSFW